MTKRKRNEPSMKVERVRVERVKGEKVKEPVIDVRDRKGGRVVESTRTSDRTRAMSGRYVKKSSAKRTSAPESVAVESVGHADTGLDVVGPDTHEGRSAEHFIQIVAAQASLNQAEQDLRDAVAAAREAGDSWTLVGAALGVSKQAAAQRFGTRLPKD